MAQKRKIAVERKIEENEPVPEMGWKDWLLRRYARYWYWAAVMFLDVVLLLESQRSLGLELATAVGVTALVLVVEVFIYIRVWGKNGPLSEKADDEDW